jgi:hypothetical protein
MSTFKQVHIKFWQNDFVLGLSAEERYFYIYLITNSMTNQCGIFKLNRRLAELETGYTAEQIGKYLEKFQEYGKVVVSPATTEIMLVNWFKHNFKCNKKTITLINKELKDVKDKELLKKLYDACRHRQYPVEEIFNGIILQGVEIKKVDMQTKASSQAEVEIQDDVKVTVEQDEKITEVSAVSEQNLLLEEIAKTDLIKFNGFLMKGSDEADGEEKVDDENEEVCILEDCWEEDSEEIEGGTTIACWNFLEDAELEYSSALAIGEGSAVETDVRNTA